MPKNPERLSAEALLEGVTNLSKQRISLKPCEDASQIVLEIYQQKAAEGWTSFAIIHKVYTDFFTSEDSEIVDLRDQWIAQNGGGDKIQYFPDSRTGEYYVLFKARPKD